jgi:hypothetical protein
MECGQVVDLSRGGERGFILACREQQHGEQGGERGDCAHTTFLA